MILRETSMKELRNKDGLTEEEFLAAYSPGDYDRPSVTVDILVFAVSKDMEHLKILLIKRKDHPFMNCWAIPGGFVNIDESSEDAAARELEEETGLTGLYLEQLRTYSNPGRDPRMRVISVSYIALVPEDQMTVIAGDDATDAKWFEITQSHDKIDHIKLVADQVLIEYKLKKETIKNGKISVTKDAIAYCFTPLSKLAFDHEIVLLDGIDRIRNKAEYTSILFNLMPEEFTLSSLQKLYETVLGKSLYKANFRRKIKELVESTGKMDDNSDTGRPSELYRLKK